MTQLSVSIVGFVEWYEQSVNAAHVIIAWHQSHGLENKRVVIGWCPRDGGKQG
jgi:hypothetical protein